MQLLRRSVPPVTIIESTRSSALVSSSRYAGDDSSSAASGTLYLCGAGNSEGVRLALRVNESERRWQRIVLLDDDDTKWGRTMLGVEIVGSFELLSEADPDHDEVQNLVARTTVGREGARTRISSFGIPFATLISPGVDREGVSFAGDVIVYHNATLGPEVTLGESSVVFMGAIVGHECTVGRGCVIASNAVLNARVVLGDRVYVGSNATVLPENEIGEGATIGAGSVVVQDVPAGATAFGVPAQVMVRADQTSSNAEAARAKSQLLVSEIEQAISEVWSSVLDIDDVMADENFFDVGGKSLDALRVVEQICSQTTLEVSIMDMFRFPTIRSLAAWLSDGALPAHHGQLDDGQVHRGEVRAAIRRYRAGPRA